MDNKWREFANCKGMPLDWFFDEYEQSAAVQLQVDNTCANCVVRLQCLEWAERNGFEGGVAGRKFFSQAPKKRQKRREKLNA